MSSFPPNTHKIWCLVTVTLPEGETPDQQDPSMVFTGGDFDPWPGVQIHDVVFLCHKPVES